MPRLGRGPLRAEDPVAVQEVPVSPADPRFAGRRDAADRESAHAGDDPHQLGGGQRPARPDDGPEVPAGPGQRVIQQRLKLTELRLALLHAASLPQPASVGRVATGTEHVSPEIYEYVMSHSSPPDPVLDELRAETSRRFPEWAHLQIGPEQGTFITLLSRVAAPRRVIEVGTFTGYSAICLARGLAPGGSLLCCDVSADWTSLAREYWQKAGLDSVIELRLGPGADTLRSLPADASLDLAFIDADKTGYAVYWDEIVPRTRPGGIILVDNTFMHGRIFDDDPDPDARAVRDFNEQALADDRVELAMLSVGDGLMIARKK